jgi:alkylated DNA repair dioxygenase AlkB
MNTLFSIEPDYPPGFSYFPDFITEAEEQELIGNVRNIDLHPMNFQGYEAKRKVASFGYDWSFEKRVLTKGKEIPAAFSAIIEKVAAKASISKNDFGELLLTEYPEGSVINWHRDAPPFNLIAGISLATDCTFRLRPHDKSKQGRKSILSFPVKRRSLYLMQGEARTNWEHSITPLKSIRYSITLRTLS